MSQREFLFCKIQYWVLTKLRFEFDEEHGWHECECPDTCRFFFVGSLLLVLNKAGIDLSKPFKTQWKGTAMELVKKIKKMSETFRWCRGPSLKYVDVELRKATATSFREMPGELKSWLESLNKASDKASVQ